MRAALPTKMTTKTMKMMTFDVSLDDSVESFHPDQRALGEDFLPKPFDSTPISVSRWKRKLRFSIGSTVLHEREEADTHRFDDSFALVSL